MNRGNYKRVNKPNNGFRHGSSKKFNNSKMVVEDDKISLSHQQSRFRQDFRQNQKYKPRGGAANFNNRNNYQGKDFNNRRPNERYQRGPSHNDGGYRNNRPRNNTEVESEHQWYKIKVIGGKQFGSKEKILTDLKAICSCDFTPIEYDYEGSTNFKFHIKSTKVKDSLIRCSHMLVDSDGYKLKIVSEIANIPYTKINNDVREKLKIILSNRYDVPSKKLDLSNFSSDKDAASEGMIFPLFRTHVMEPILHIIRDNIPELHSLWLNSNELKSLFILTRLHEYAPQINSLNLGCNSIVNVNELDHLKSLKLLELYLDGNRLCDKFDNPTSYVSAIRKKFPKIQSLDGHQLPPTITFDVEDTVDLPPIKGSYFPDDSYKDLVCRFIQQYFLLYDSGDRKPLVEAYHDNAVFSLCSSLNKNAAKSNSMRPYIDDKFNRNMNRTKAKDKCHESLKCGKKDIIDTLILLPLTKHSMSAFSIDVIASSTNLLLFCVYGTFKEIDKSSAVKDCFRSFTRTFLTVPQGSGIVIVNEELTISNATSTQITQSCNDPPPTPSTSPAPQQNQPNSPISQNANGEQQMMLKQFSLQSGMNEEFSLKCLLECQWDYQKAAEVFTDLQNKGIIPPEAFVK